MKRDAIAIALLVAIIGVVFGDMLFLGRNIYFRDVTRYYYPSKKLVRDIVLGGELPSWNPYWASGQPLAANPDYGTFYPVQWLTLLPDYDLWFRIHVVLHYWIAAVGAYLLMRRWTARQESAMVAALLFSLGGVLVSLTSLLPCLYAAVWLPWVVWATDRMLERFSWRRFAAAALLLAMPMLAAEPVTVAQICLLTAVFAVLRQRTVRVLPQIIGMGLSAFAVAAVQLIPAADLFRDSARSRGFPFQLVSIWSTPPVRFLELLVPQLTGPSAEHFRFYWGTAKYAWLDPFYLGIYFGVIAAAFAVAGLTRRICGWRPVLLSLVAGSLIALGSHTPLLRILYETHLFSSLRYPEKFLFLAFSPLIFFSAFAFDRAMNGDVRIVRRALVVTAIAAAFCAILLIASLMPSYAPRFIRFWDIGIHPLASAMARLSMSIWLASLVRTVVAAGVLWFALSEGRGPRAEGRHRWASLAIALLALDLGWQRLSIAETVDGRFFRVQPAAVAQIDPDVRVFHQADWYGAAPVARAYFDLPEMYWVIRNGLFPMFGRTWGIASAMNTDVDQTFLHPAVEFNEAIRELHARGVRRWWEPLMAMSAAGYRAMYLPFDQQLAKARNDRTAIQPIIFVRVPTNPRYYFADRVLTTHTRADFVRHIAQGAATARAALAPIEPFTPAAARVIRIREGSHWSDVDVESTGDALLVCSVTRHKYWRVTIDGRAASVIPVNLQYQAVRVGAGRHRVSLRYRNPLLLAGGLTSLMAMAFLIALIIRGRDRAQL